jgi:hypothetical protein
MRKILIAIIFAVVANLSSAQNQNAPGVDVYDGFESPELSQLWSNDRFAPGAVTMQTNIVRAGHGAAQITVRPREKFEAGRHGDQDSERAELLEAKQLLARENCSYEQSFSLFIPTNFPIVPTRLVIAQWKQFCPEGENCDDDSPVLALRYISGTLKITQNLNSKHATVLYQEAAEFRGRWLDFKFQTRFSAGTNGVVKAWLGGKPVLDFRGVTANPENAATGYPSPGLFYFKTGLYRDVMAGTMTIYLDEYRKKQLPDNFFDTR